MLLSLGFADLGYEVWGVEQGAGRTSEMSSGHPELEVRIELLYHAEFESIHSPAFAREENYGRKL